MLVLSRKPGQSIQIGSDVTLHIVAVRGSAVRVAIQAPLSVAIRRGELRSIAKPVSATPLQRTEAGSVTGLKLPVSKDL
jgi:carbon storage regulator